MDSDRSEFRDRIAERLRADLIGPLLTPDEVLTSRPSDVYLSGILWPPRIDPDPEDNDRLETASTDGDSAAEGGEESAVAASSVQKPSVAGSIVLHGINGNTEHFGRGRIGTLHRRSKARTSKERPRNGTVEDVMVVIEES